MVKTPIAARGIFILILLISLSTRSFGQDNPAPEYLVRQNFPDSVSTLEIIKLNGDRIPFSTLLETYKSKKVLLDFWASWCKDCISGLPNLEKLKSSTRDRNVVYVCISIDKDEAKWKSAIDKFHIEGEHYRIESGWKNALSNYIDLDWIPRYMVLNETGNILIPKAVSASDPALKKSLLE